MSLSTLAISKEFEANGFSMPQAQILAETIVEAVESDSKNLVTRDYLKAETATVKSELKAEIAELRTELKSDIAGLETKMTAFETRVIKWMIGLQFTTIGLVVGLIYFLLRH
jgi:hypothetical protein